MSVPVESSRSRPRRRRRAAAKPWQLLLAGMLLFGATAGAIYWYAQQHAGRSAPLADAPADAASGAAAAHRGLPADRLERMIEEMTQRVKADAKDSSAWALLAHSYGMLGRFDESIKAYARLAELLPDDAQVMADYADALAVAQGRNFKGEPEKLLQRALALDPKNVKALLLAGTEAFERQAYAESIGHWERARALATEPRTIGQIDSGLAEARALQTRVAASAPGSARVAKGTVTPAATEGQSVSGRVSLAPALASRAAPDDTVFVFARSTLGSRMPVALLRRKVRDLPLDFRLDDTMAMVPEVRLSALSSVVIGARVSKRGDAVPQAGDLQGFSPPVAVGSRGVKLEIAEVLP